MLIKTSDGEKNVTRFGQGVYNTVGASAGIAALLGLGNGNGLGLFNNGTGNCNPCTVSERQFYETELANRDREFANYTSLNDKICELAQRVSVDETAIAYQNKLTDKQFECVDKQMGWDRIATTYQIDAKTCDFVKAKHYISPSQMADPYLGRQNILATYAPYYGYNNCGCGYGNFGWGWNNYSDCGCGCGGF